MGQSNSSMFDQVVAKMAFKAPKNATYGEDLCGGVKYTKTITDHQR